MTVITGGEVYLEINGKRILEGQIENAKVEIHRDDQDALAFLKNRLMGAYLSEASFLEKQGTRLNTRAGRRKTMRAFKRATLDLMWAAEMEGLITPAGVEWMKGLPVEIAFEVKELGPCAAHGENPCDACFNEWKNSL